MMIRYICAIIKIQGALRAGHKCSVIFAKRLEWLHGWRQAGRDQAGRDVSTGILHRSFDAVNRP